MYSHTTIYQAPSGYNESTLYTVALIKLAKDPMVTAQLTYLGNQPVEISIPVEMVTSCLRSDGDERGVLVYGYKFRPALRA